MDEILAKLEACMAALDRMAPVGGDVKPLNSGCGGNYVSMVKIRGKPILPPLMTPAKRAEMARYKAEAVQRERERREKKHQNLIARVETIVNSYEESRQSLMESKENSPLQTSDNVIGHSTQSSAIPVVETEPLSREEPKNNPSYSPLKYMEVDEGEDEWNVRPATPWRRTKSSKTRMQIAAKFEAKADQPISSTLRVDQSGENVARGTTPDVSAISFVSSAGALSSISPVGATGQSPPAPIIKEILPPGSPAFRDPKAISMEDGNLLNPGDKKSPSPVGPELKANIGKAKDGKSPVHTELPLNNSSEGHEEDSDIHRISPIQRVEAVMHTGNGVTASTGSQSTSTSSSSNSALNQTVIDLSQMSLTQGEKSQEIMKKSLEIGAAEQKRGGLSTRGAESKVGQGKEDAEKVVREDLVGNLKDDVNVVQYLSDTESYMSLLGEYSQLPSRASTKTPDSSGAPMREMKKGPFFPDLTGNVAAGNENESDAHQQENRKEDRVGLNAAAVGASVAESLKSVDTSEYYGSSLGTLAQSVTLPISLSMTSESTLQGVEEVWDRTSQDVTPTCTEGGMSTTSDDLRNVGMVRAAPVGEESSASTELVNIFKQDVVVFSGTDKHEPDVPKPDTSVDIRDTLKVKSEDVKITDQRSGVKVESDFKTPLRQHARKSSYTLDFPSPALLDAEARHQAPHVSGSDVSYTGAGAKPKGSDKTAGSETETNQVPSSDNKEPDVLSEMKDLKLDDASEAKVLSLQLSYLEQMQQRLQRQHEEQMKELMLQQSQELQLLEVEMEGIRRQAAGSALGHSIDKDVKNVNDESVISTVRDKVSNSEDQHSKSSPVPIPTQASTEDNTGQNESPRERKNPPPSPNSRKRRHDETSSVELYEVPSSYIRPSSLAGGQLKSQVGDKSKANTKKKLTPQDSLEKELVEVPPSYIINSSHKPVSRSPTHKKSLDTPTNKNSGGDTTPSASQATPTNEIHDRNSSHLTTWATPSKETSKDDPVYLSTWASISDEAGGSGLEASSAMHDPHLSDSFFLTESQMGGLLMRQGEQQDHHQPRAHDFRPWTITPSLQMDSRFDKLSATVKGYLTRALMRTPKVMAIVKTIKDTQSFLFQFQAETPVKRGKLSDQDTKLAHRVLAQLRAAQYEMDDIFHVYPVHQRMAILRHAREQERENFFNKKVSPPSAGEKAKHLSAATRKAIERRLQHAKEGEAVGSGSKRQKLGPSQPRPKSAAETRVLKPLQSQKLPGRPATAVPPRTSPYSFSTHVQKPKPSANSGNPFATKPVMVSRNTAKTTRSPSRLTSRPGSTRPTSSRPTSRLTAGPVSQSRNVSGRQGRSPARVSSSQTKTKTKSVRRSLYPVTVGTGKKNIQRKQAESRKP